MQDEPVFLHIIALIYALYSLFYYLFGWQTYIKSLEKANEKEEMSS